MSSQTVGAAYMMAEGQGVNYENVRRNGFVITIEGLDLELKAYSTNLPSPEIETASVYHGNERSQYATKPVVGDIRAEIYDFITPSAVAELWTWWKQVYNSQNGQIGYASEYKRKGTIDVVDVKGNTIYTWYMAGLIIKRAPTPEENMAFDNHEAMQISLVMSCDWASLDNVQRGSIGQATSTVAAQILP